jgi:2-polyprenyl-3-methyl-5-hydroxy-6-metoxy-1,4-benzoquinol methylase
LDRAYGALDTATYYGEIAKENAQKMVASTKALSNLARTARIIDIGTGNGLFLKHLQEAGFTNLAGHEISDDGSHMVDATFYFGHDYRSVPSEAFDCATLLDVVEHVPDPAFLMHACHRILKPDGVIYFHTPVVTPTDRSMQLMLKVPGARKLAAVWLRGRTSIYHLQNYTHRALEKLLLDAGFTDIHIRLQNELSWPVSMYVRVYLVNRYRLPGFLTWLLTPLLYPLLKTDLMNANKAIVRARKA